VQVPVEEDEHNDYSTPTAGYFNRKERSGPMVAFRSQLFASLQGRIMSNFLPGRILMVATMLLACSSIGKSSYLDQEFAEYNRGKAAGESDVYANSYRALVVHGSLSQREVFQMMSILLDPSSREALIDSILASSPCQSHEYIVATLASEFSSPNFLDAFALFHECMSERVFWGEPESVLIGDLSQAVIVWNDDPARRAIDLTRLANEEIPVSVPQLTASQIATISQGLTDYLDGVDDDRPSLSEIAAYYHAEGDLQSLLGLIDMNDDVIACQIAAFMTDSSHFQSTVSAVRSKWIAQVELVRNEVDAEDRLMLAADATDTMLAATEILRRRFSSPSRANLGVRILIELTDWPDPQADSWYDQIRQRLNPIWIASGDKPSLVDAIEEKRDSEGNLDPRLEELLTFLQ